MKNVRIYKDDIRTNILRSLFFTDTALVIVGSMVIGLVIYLVFVYGFKTFNWSYYLSSLFVGIIFFIAFITQKIDNQPIYKIIPRAVNFRRTKKEQRFRNLDPYFVDFTIQDNHVIRKQSIIRIFEIEPHDIALLNEQDREHFFAKLKQTIHILPSQIQIIVKKERATSNDYSKHIFSIYNSTVRGREHLVNRYVSELTALIDSNNFVITKHYAVISVNCQTKNPNSKIEAFKKINDAELRFASGLALCNISLKSLSNEELIKFMKETLR